MKKISKTIVALAATTVLAGPAMAETKLTFTTYVPQAYSIVTCEDRFMDEVTKRTDGEVVFERFYAGTLLNAPDTFPGIGRGAADIGMSYPSGYNRAEYPLSNIVMPYMSANPVAATQAYNDLINDREEYAQEYERGNTKILYSTITIGHSLWTRDPVRTADDVKGKRIRALLAVGDALDKMGATVVAMPFPDTVEAMSRGAIDGFANVPFDLGVTAGIDKVSSYVSDLGGMGVFAASSTAINLDVWNGLSPEIQNTMMEVAGELPHTCWPDVVDKDIEKSVQSVLDTTSVEVVMFSSEEAKKLSDTIGGELRQEWVEWVDSEGYDGEAILARFEELIAKYEEQSDFKNSFQRYTDAASN